MTEAFDEDVASAPTAGTGGTNAAALNAALTGPSASTEEARQFLDEQKRLTALQARILGEQHALEISHLRFRRYSDYARFALEIGGFLVVLLIVCGLATMVWNASRDRDLVVDSFAVPADVSQSGMTGSVLAGRILDRFGKMQSETVAFSQGAASYRGDVTNEVRVEIPSTGISLGELNRYLREWLGHEVHVSGDLVQAGQSFALTTRYGVEPGATVMGKPGELDNLVDKSAEQIFAAAQPLRFVEYLARKRRFAEALALLPGLVVRGTAQDRALANEAWAKVYFFQGDMPRALERGREAVRLDPDSSLAHAWLGVAEGNFGHEESAYTNMDAAVRLFVENSGADESEYLRLGMAAFRDENAGDFADAVRTWARWADSEPLLFYTNAEEASGDAADDHDLSAARRFAAAIRAKDTRGRPQAGPPTASFYIHLAAGDWRDAIKDGAAADTILKSQPDQKYNALALAPDYAYATARAGDFKTADAIVASTPWDCDTCVRERGRVAALEGHWKEAARDFAIVASRSPHEPFAETFWGEMLLHNGDFDGAVSKFEAAHQKGPHFADPLEMWGEALMQKNRSDLALAKFEEAAKYAPNWGRLHLKWGEALHWSGDKVGAQKQLDIATSLDLSTADKAELARVSATRG